MSKSLQSLLIFACLVLTSQFSQAQFDPSLKKEFNLKGTITKAYTPAFDGGHIAGFYYTETPQLCSTIRTHNSKHAIAKISPSGKVEWKHCYTTLATTPHEIIPSIDKNSYWVAGSTNRRFDYKLYEHVMKAWITRLDEDGQILLDTGYGVNGYSTYAESITTTKDGGVVLVGHRYKHSDIGPKGHVDMEVFVYKVDSRGQKIWEYYADRGPLWESAKNVIETKNGDFVLCGGSSVMKMGPLHQGAAWVVRLNANGKKLWARNYGSGKHDFFGGLVESAEGGLLLVGRESHNTNIMANCGRRGLWIVKMSDKGRVQWQKFMNDKSPGKRSYAKMESIVQLKDGTYLIGGVDLALIRNGSPYLMRISNQGEVVWTNTMWSDLCEGIAFIDKIKDGEYRVTGFIYNYEGGLHFDTWSLPYFDETKPKMVEPLDTTEQVVVLYAKKTPKEKSKQKVERNDLFLANLSPEQPTFYPNPVLNDLTLDLKSQKAKVDVSIWDRRGKMALTEQWTNIQTVTLTTSGLKPGNYVLQVTADGRTDRLKLVKVRE